MVAAGCDTIEICHRADIYITEIGNQQILYSGLLICYFYVCLFTSRLLVRGNPKTGFAASQWGSLAKNASESWRVRVALVDFVNTLSEKHELKAWSGLLLLYLEENKEAFTLGTFKGEPEFLFMFLKLE